MLEPQLISYAKHEGVKTINVVRDHKHVQELKDLGCDLHFDITLCLIGQIPV